MKARIVFLLTAFMMLFSVSANAENIETPIKGDVNGDGVIDVGDINAIIDIMWDGMGENYYWYVGYGDTPTTVDTNNIKTSASETGWHNFTEGTTSLHVGPLYNSSNVNWFVLVPAASGLSNVVDAGEVLGGYTNSTITVDGVSYTKITQDEKTKRFDYDIRPTYYYAPILSVDPIKTNMGEQTTMTVKLSGAVLATALQFNFSLPANVTIDESGCILGSAASNHTLRVNKLKSGDYLFVLYSMDFTALTDGTLLTIPITIGDNASTGNGNLATVRSAGQDAVSWHHQDATFEVTVTDDTAVGSIKSNLKQHGVIYNVRGQKLASPQKGINIIDGRKVIVK